MDSGYDKVQRTSTHQAVAPGRDWGPPGRTHSGRGYLRWSFPGPAGRRPCHPPCSSARVTCQGGGITGIQANIAGGMFVIRGIGTKMPGWDIKTVTRSAEGTTNQSSYDHRSSHDTFVGGRYVQVSPVDIVAFRWFASSG